MTLFPYNKLLASACEFLRYELGCYLISWERGPWDNLGHRPDVIGVEKGRRVIEIEIKRSKADFVNDANKRIWFMRQRGMAKPHRFYYLVPPELVEKVIDLVPEGSGLLTLGPRHSYGGNLEIISVRAVKADRTAKPLTLKQVAVMAKAQSGALVSAISQLAKQNTIAEAVVIASPDET